MERKDLKKYEAPATEVVCADSDVELLTGSVTIEQPEDGVRMSEDFDVLEALGIQEFKF